MKRLLLILTFISLTLSANTDLDILEPEHELGIAPIEIEAPPRAGDELVLDLPDYNEDTIVKKIEIDTVEDKYIGKYNHYNN